MTPLDKQIVSAIKTLIRRNQGEFHGDWPEIADMIAVEINGVPSDFIVKQYDDHMRNMGLKYFLEDHPDIYFMRGMNGDLNFIDRSLVYDVTSVTVHKTPGGDPVIEWLDLR